MRQYSEKIMGVKAELIMAATIFLVIIIFIFDIRVSKIIQRIPLLSSVIDTKVLEEFETINENDEFYRALMKENDILSRPIPNFPITSSGNMGTNSGYDSPFVPDAIESILPEGARIRDIHVRPISTSEKLFRITLDTGEVRYVQVRKDDGKWDIIGK